MNIFEAKQRLSNFGKVGTDAPPKLLAFSVQGTVPGSDLSLWATALAPAGHLAEAAQVVEWSKSFGDEVTSTHCKPLNGGVFVSVIVK